MLVLGLQGSPRKNGNTNRLLSMFLDEAEKLGARTRAIQITDCNIEMCRGCMACEKTGHCVIEDDEMTSDVYSLLREADVVAAATPIYFYSATAQLKAVIDRSQTLWSRKYRFKLADPKSKHRLGLLLAVGATKGENLFTGLELTMKYFFDAVDADYAGNLIFRRIEKKADMENNPFIFTETRDMVKQLLPPLSQRKKVLFACRENAGRSQMAAAFAQVLGGDKIDAFSGGSLPAESVNPVMADAMQEKGIDMAFLKPQSMETAISGTRPDIIVTMGCGEQCPVVPGAEMIDWFFRKVRDEIEQRVKEFISSTDWGSTD